MKKTTAADTEPTIRFANLPALFEDIPTNSCSYWAFRYKKMEFLIGKMQKTKKPIVLVDQGVFVAVICDYQHFNEIEQRRRRLVAQL